jgi:uncharacterized protein (DUF2141 family)
VSAPSPKRWRRCLRSVPVILICIIGCAKPLPPPGGPVDKTPPESISVSPSSGSVRVASDTRVTVQFSEPLDRNTAAKAVFITPQPKTDPDIKIKGDRITIAMREPLEADRTYVVTLGTDLKDAHGVNLAQSLSIAFSTGETIDSGSLSGTVFKGDAPAAGVSAALFINDPGASGQPIDSLRPEYITQSGKDGAYAFQYLPAGAYFLVAFDDKNKNRRIDVASEAVGLPFRKTVVDSTHRMVKQINVKLHDAEPPGVEIRSAAVTPDRLIKLRLSRKIELAQAARLLATASLSDAHDSTALSTITEWTNLTPYPCSDFALLWQGLLPGADYRLHLDVGAVFPATVDSLRLPTYSFRSDTAADRNPPLLLETIPADKALNVNPDSLLFLRFSEPLDSATLRESIWLKAAETESSAVVVAAADAFSYRASTAAPLQYGTAYQWQMNGRRIKDPAANPLSDSTLARTFTTVGRDTLGQLSGELRFTDTADAAYPIVITMSPAGEGVSRQMTLTPGQRQFLVELLPGYYTVGAFLDRNANGAFDFGSIIPYQAAEPFTAAVDTFRVRTRFESAGVILEL